MKEQCNGTKEINGRWIVNTILTLQSATDS